jgi:AhpD family alkylhydroperoxidase
LHEVHFQEAIMRKDKKKPKNINKKNGPSEGVASAAKKAAVDPALASDDVRFLALSLPEANRSPSMQAYFEKCEEKLGFVPNVLKAYAFDMAKLEAFVAMYNDLMLAPSGLSKLEREMIAVAVSSQNRCYYCLVAHGAAVRQLSGNPQLGAEPWLVEEADREQLRKVGFSDRDIWDIAAVAAFFNMTNRVASATDMRPNTVYHAQAR